MTISDLATQLEERVELAVLIDSANLAALGPGHGPVSFEVDDEESIEGLRSRTAGLGQHWWDPFGWWDDESVPDVGVDEALLTEASWDPADVHQGGIGDCYLLSSLMGFMRTDRGDTILKDGVRWDSARGGFWVTLFPDGEAREVFVDQVYEQGATEDEWSFLFLNGSGPNVTSLYEAAVSQELGYADFDDGGWPSDAMELVTGLKTTTFVTDDSGGQDFEDMDLGAVRSAVASGGSVVATSDYRLGHGRLTVEAEVTAGGKIEERSVDIVINHAYSVEKVDGDGSAWLRNPWGPGNSADGGELIHVSAADFSNIFYRVDVSETP